MIRGTTPTLVFKIPFQLTNFNRGWVTFVQLAEDGSVISYLDKALSDCILDANMIELTLTQEETLAFYPNIPLNIQIRLADEDGKAPASDIITEPVFDVLKDGVI